VAGPLVPNRTRLIFHSTGFVRPGTEFTYIQQAIDEMHVSGNGRFTKLCHALLEEMLGAPKVLLTTSCTDALEMAALLLDVQPGDEVILPSFTFVSTASAFALRGARPVFIDIRPDTLNLDETLLERADHAAHQGHRAGALCGRGLRDGCDPRNCRPSWRAGGRRQCARLLGKYKGRNLGTFGCLATQSFHETKNFTCGEGGALVINDAGYCEQAEIIRDKGTNRSRFVRGQVDKYTWVGLGSSYLPSDILAAILYAQLESRETFRRSGGISGNVITCGCETGPAVTESAARSAGALPAVFHMFYLMLPSEGQPRAPDPALEGQEHTERVSLSSAASFGDGAAAGREACACPVTEDVSNRLLRLPFYNGLTRASRRG
jgi:dTDP-4-amino-4,6-dideoxygalactose transaminase